MFALSTDGALLEDERALPAFRESSSAPVYGIFNDLNIDCGCFTAEEINKQDGLKLALYRDLILIGGAFFLFLSKWYGQRNAANQSMWKKLRSIKRRF
jgi:hypothetical protein